MEKIQITRLPDEPIVHDLTPSQEVISKSMKLGAVLIVILGLVSGYVLSVPSKSANRSSNSSVQTGTQGDNKKSVGSNDTALFPDTTEGTLERGGINGEGTHHLVRPGGVSQTVYLTSSVLDLNQFMGKKVKIWGKTFAADKAGWLMDVGKVQPLE